jgi:hypothetical protein
MELTTPFPLPPAHYTEFTPDYKSKQSQYTIPPSPIVGQFTAFGQIDDINFQPKLQDNIPPLSFQLDNRKDQLKEINKRLKSRFVDLLTVLGGDTNGVIVIDRHWKL